MLFIKHDKQLYSCDLLSLRAVTIMAITQDNRCLWALCLLTLCSLTIGECLETDKGDTYAVMIKDGLQHRSSYSKRAAEKVPCQPLPRAQILKIMGAAFNPHYMSIEAPEVEPSAIEALSAGQKDQEYQRKKSLGSHAGFVSSLHEPIAIYYTKDESEGGAGGSGHRYRVGQDNGDWTEFAAMKKPPTRDTATTSGHRRRHHHSPRTTRDGRSGQSGMDDFKRDGRRGPYGQDGQSGEHVQYGQTGQIDSKENFKMDGFEQGEPPDKPSLDSKPKTGGQGEKLSGSEKFVKSVRGKRASLLDDKKWVCKSEFKWMDLGANHAPRFLRSVVCTKKECYNEAFHCQGKAFTVKVLRRRKDSCSSEEVKGEEGPMAEDVHNRGENSYVPKDFREQWVFEERAVTFCCECWKDEN